MSIACLGINHQTAPIALLERISLTQARAEHLLTDLCDTATIGEIAALSTCNRVELYLSAENVEEAAEAVLRALVEGDPSALRSHAYMHIDEAAAEHLFRVAAGIDSLVLGEAQILGQLRKAHETARSLATVSGNLNVLFQRAVSFGRRVRQETGIGRGNLSVAALATTISREHFGGLADKEVLVLGAGETASIAARCIAKEKPGRIRIINRTIDNARALATEVGGEALPLDRLQEAIGFADVVISAIGAPHVIVTADGLGCMLSQRRERPILLIDLSLPRNIDPEAAALAGVTLYGMEQLEDVVAAHRASRQGEVAVVERMIARELRSWKDWTSCSAQHQLVVSLRRQVSEIHERVIERQYRTAAPELREEIARFGDSLLRAVLHDATSYIRTLDPHTEQGRMELEIVRQLFSLGGMAPVEVVEEHPLPR